MANEHKDLSKAIAKKESNKVALKKDDSLHALVERMLPAYEQALMGNKALALRFGRIVQTMVKKTPDLINCVPSTVLGASLTIAQLGLDPDLQEAWIIPRYNKNTGKKEASYQLGIRGAEKLFYQASPNSIIEAREVWSYDEFEVSYGAEPKLIHIPYKNEGKVNGEPYVTFYYTVVRFKNGMSTFYVMTREAIEAHRKKWKAGGMAWNTSPDEMSMNTVTKKLLKRLPKSAELAYALQDDNRIKQIKDSNEIDGTYNILEQPHEPENIADPIDSDSNKEEATKTKPSIPPKEIVVEETAEDLQKNIINNYIEIKKLSKTYTDSYIMGINEEMLGVKNVKNCSDLSKLHDLYDMLDNEIYNFEQEV